MKRLIDIYSDVKECRYRDERYSVRDNGAVLRHTPKNKRVRQTDYKWTFGTVNKRDRYLVFVSERIHRIVATAFHGEPPTKEYVVDHIDTNRQNNRPDNLRWVTRLENILLNPITVKRIETTCGCSIEEFLDDPAKYKDKFKEPNLEWMCTVSKEEAQTSKKRLIAWAQNEKRFNSQTISGYVNYRNLPNHYEVDISEITESLTPNAVQMNWRTPAEFLCCPSEITENPIENYFSNISLDKIFLINKFGNSFIEDYAISDDKNTLWVVCRSDENNAIKPYSFTEVAFENNLFVHKGGTFFKKDGAEQAFTIARGLEWVHGETIDELCS